MTPEYAKEGDPISKILAWAFIGTLVILTLVPAGYRPVTGIQHDLEHSLAFVLAGVLFGHAYRLRPGIALLGPVVFALALELSQIPLQTRHARVEDFIVNSIAGMAGMVIASLIANLRSRLA